MTGGARLALGATTLLVSAVVFAVAGQAAERQPGTVHEYCRAAEADFRSGRIGSAVVAYNRGIALSPTDARPYIGLAVLYEAVDRSDLAVAALEQLQSAAPSAPHLLCRLAEANLGAEDVRAALPISAEAARAEAGCPRAWSVFGICLARQRQWQSAASALERARALAPDDRGIVDTLIEVYLQQARHREAIEAAKEQLLRQPESARLHYKIGWAYARSAPDASTAREAERWLRRATELDPRWFEPWAELGRWNASMGRPREAAAAFEKAWEQSRAVPGVAYNLARLWQQLGDPRAAQVQRTFTQLLRQQSRISVARYRHNSVPGDRSAAIKVSEMEGELQQYGSALHRLRGILQQDPANPPALKLYVRLDRESRRELPELLAPGPAVRPAQL